jgi:hypothetical protein
MRQLSFVVSVDKLPIAVLDPKAPLARPTCTVWWTKMWIGVANLLPSLGETPTTKARPHQRRAIDVSTVGENSR